MLEVPRSVFRKAIMDSIPSNWPDNARAALSSVANGVTQSARGEFCFCPLTQAGITDKRAQVQRHLTPNHNLIDFWWSFDDAIDAYLGDDTPGNQFKVVEDA